MSGSQPPGGAGKDAQSDPSMEDILASIRRILSEDMPQPATLEGEAPTADKPADVLVLDESMLVPEPKPPALPAPVQAAPPPPPPVQAAPPPPAPEPEPIRAEPSASLVSPEVMAAASSAVTNMVRTLAAERQALVRPGGATIEDLVREELRPMLKQWLDAHLSPLVERLVKAEIERVVGRIVP
jgi:cell pole-organizing protein PopZ